jgi:hypothetical protein
VSSIQEVERLTAKGAKRRAVGSHLLNSRSSRSHSVLIVSLRTTMDTLWYY